MTTKNDYPYARRPGLPLIDNEEGLIEVILMNLNAILDMAGEAGVSVRLCFRDAGAQDRSADRLEKIEFEEPAGEGYWVAQQDTVTISQAAKLVGISRSAMRGRVHRAHRADRETPFKWSEWHDCWEADPEAVKVWAASWTGQSAQRPSRSKRTPA